jgi:hypothetical protein
LLERTQVLPRSEVFVNALMQLMRYRELDNMEHERMEKMREEIEAARGAIKRAAALVKGSKSAEAEIWQLLQKLEDEARDLTFEYETHHRLPGAAISRSQMRSRD